LGDDAALPSPNENEYCDPSQEDLVDLISAKGPYVLNPACDVRIVVPDFSAKANILRAHVRRGALVAVLPWKYSTILMRSAIDLIVTFCPVLTR